MIPRLYLTYLDARYVLGRILRMVGLFYAVLFLSLGIGAAFEAVVGSFMPVHPYAIQAIWFTAEITILLYWFRKP